MKNVNYLIVSGFLIFSCSQVFASSCGPFGVFKSSDYCLKCPDTQPRKVKNCPGGEAGRVAVGTSHPNCQVSFYNKYCLAQTPYSMDLEQDQYTGNVKDGEASVIPDGDYYVIKMTKNDYEKLMQSSQGVSAQNNTTTPSDNSGQSSSQTEAKKK
jgi:hypothetical protein